jgi:hypothetical protein
MQRHPRLFVPFDFMKYRVNLNNIQGLAIEHDDFEIAVLINCAVYKKHKKLRSISSKMTFSIRLLFFTLAVISG